MSTLTLVVLLFVEPDGQAEFEEFEASASDIMKRHGGTIERRIRFPAGVDLRRTAIRNTIVWSGSDCPPFLTR